MSREEDLIDKGVNDSCDCVSGSYIISRAANLVNIVIQCHDVVRSVLPLVVLDSLTTPKPSLTEPNKHVEIHSNMH